MEPHKEIIAKNMATNPPKQPEWQVVRRKRRYSDHWRLGARFSLEVYLPRAKIYIPFQTHPTYAQALASSAKPSQSCRPTTPAHIPPSLSTLPNQLHRPPHRQPPHVPRPITTPRIALRPSVSHLLQSLSSGKVGALSVAARGIQLPFAATWQNVAGAGRAATQETPVGRK